MSQTFYTLLTAVGEAKHANAVATGTKVNYSAMAVGDGNGNATLPNRLQTSLVNEVRRAAINQVSIDPDNDAQIIIEQVIPENVGGWWIREVGIFDDDGDLIAVANVPPTYKPQLQEGSGRTQVVRVVLLVSSTAAVAIKIDPSIVLATQQYVNDVFDLIPKASAAGPGLVELATVAEAKTLVDKMRAITPETLGTVLDTYFATEQTAGTVRLATTTHAEDLTNDDVVVTPKKLSDAMNAHVLGMGQTWQALTEGRAFDTTYTNTTGRAIFVSVIVREIGANAASLNVDGIIVGQANVGSVSEAIDVQLTAIVPPASEYYLSRGGTTQQLMFWRELR